MTQAGQKFFSLERATEGAATHASLEKKAKECALYIEHEHHTLEADMEPTNWMRPRRTADAYTKRVPPRSRYVNSREPGSAI